MPLFVVKVDRIVRDVLSGTVEIAAATKEEAEQEALSLYEEGAFELQFEGCLDSEPAEAFARETKEA
tara:strand:+ start:5064 stop:5264 length:201 start_codon:yes stop_codon:yes gene_type:complete